MSEALGVPTSFLFRLWILEHRGSAKNHVDEAGARNLPLQVGCSSRCARSPSVLLCIPHDAPLQPWRRVCVYTCTQHRVLGCNVYIYTWRTTRFVTTRCCRRCRSVRAASPSPSVSRLFFLFLFCNNPASLNLLFFSPRIEVYPHIFFSLHTYAYNTHVHSILSSLFRCCTHLQFDISDSE